MQKKEPVLIENLDDLEKKKFHLFNKHIFVNFNLEKIPTQLLSTLKIQGNKIEQNF